MFILIILCFLYVCHIPFKVYIYCNFKLIYYFLHFLLFIIFWIFLNLFMITIFFINFYVQHFELYEMCF